MSLRADLIAYLGELIPTIEGLEDVRVIPSVRALDELSKPVLIVKTNGLRKLAQSPRSHMGGEFTLTLVSPHQDIDKAEDDLDARLELLLPGLFTFGLSWQSADQANYDDTRLCYDITVTSIYKRS